MRSPAAYRLALIVPFVATAVSPACSGDTTSPSTPLTSAKSFIVHGQLTASVRLPVAPGDSVVRFSLRPFGAFQSQAATNMTAIQIAVPGGDIMPVALPAYEILSESTLPSGGTVWLGDVREVEVPLPIGATNEIVFDMKVALPNDGLRDAGADGQLPGRRPAGRIADHAGMITARPRTRPARSAL